MLVGHHRKKKKAVKRLRMWQRCNDQVTPKYCAFRLSEPSDKQAHKPVSLGVSEVYKFLNKAPNGNSIGYPLSIS